MSEGAILQSLERLDARLVSAARLVREEIGEELGASSLRGLYLTREDLARLLTRRPGEPQFACLERRKAPAREGRLGRLAREYGLEAFELDVLVMAVAVEVDQRYRSIYAYLQDDVNRQLPTVGLALDLLCGSRGEAMARRRHFAAGAPLFRSGLLRLEADASERTSLPSRPLLVDEGIAAWLMGCDELDRRLLHVADLEAPARQRRTSGDRALGRMVRDARRQGTGLRLYLEGPDAAAKHELAAGLAAAAGAPLLAVRAGADLADAAAALFHAARLHDAVLYLPGVQELADGPGGAALRRRLEEFRGTAILAGERCCWQPAAAGLHGVLSLRVEAPEAHERKACWEAHLNGNGPANREVLAQVADVYRLTRGQIADAAESAILGAKARGDACVTLDDLCAAARAQTGHDLAVLTRKIVPHYGWDDIVLPADAAAQLREICWRVTERRRVMLDWGFDRKFSGGKGVSVLFAGPSGTGKTMAAEVVASALGLDLYKIDLAGVVSKYIGETERNLDRVFAAARSANAVLLFDEADALFGKRSEVRDAHDRYANIEISYLLQKMEEYEGIAVLSTNLRENIDQAFARRLAFTVAFPFPDAASRLEIWRRSWPAAVPLDSDVDLAFLAAQFKLSGGNIRNIVLAAAFRAAQRNSAVIMDDLLQSTRREFQKMGKLLSDDELLGRPVAYEAPRRLA